VQCKRIQQLPDLELKTTATTKLSLFCSVFLLSPICSQEFPKTFKQFPGLNPLYLEDCEFQTSLGYIGRPCFKISKSKKKKKELKKITLLLNMK
jgi:hypothetical protein